MFSENQISKYGRTLVYLLIAVSAYEMIKSDPVRSYGVLIYGVGVALLIWAKLPNIRARKFITYGVDQIIKPRKIAYSFSYFFMISGFLLSFW